MSLLIVVALLAPLTGAVAGDQLRRSGAALSAATWVVLAAADAPELGRLRPSPAAAAAAAGVALVLATRHGAARATRLLTAGAAVSLQAGLAAGFGHRSALPLLAGLAIAVVLVGVDELERRGWGLHLLPAALAATGAGCLAAGLQRVHHETTGWRLPIALDGRLDGETLPAGLTAMPAAAGVLVLLGAGLLAAAASVAAWRSSGAHAVLLAPALAVAVAVVPFVRPDDLPPGTVATAVAGVVAPLAALALAAAWTGRAAPALALLSVAVAAGPGAPVAAAALLAAAAVLAAALAPVLPSPAHRAALALLGVPGTAALVPVLLAHPGPAATLLGVTVSGAAGLLAWRGARGARPLEDPPPWPAGLPAAAGAAWLLIAPSSWGWVAATAVSSADVYDTGAAVAVAAGLAAAVLATLAGRRSPAG